MAPKNADSETPQPSTTGGLNLTAREQTLMMLAMQSLETEPKLNVAKFAELAGFSNPKSGANAWAAIKKKIGLSSGGAATPATPNGEKKPKTPKANKRKAADAEDGADGEAADTPVKKPRTPKVKKEIKEEDVDGPSDDE